MVKIRETLLALIIGLTGNCFDPQIKSGFSCYNGECPPQQVCHIDNICYLPEDVPKSSYNFKDAGIGPDTPEIDMNLPPNDSTTIDSSKIPLDALIILDKGYDLSSDPDASIRDGANTLDLGIFDAGTPDINCPLDLGPDVGTVDPLGWVAAAGRYFNCFNRGDGLTWCGVENGAGQSDLPDGVKQFDVPDGVPLEKICSGAHYACGITEEGIITCWGAEDEAVDFGQADPPEGHYIDLACGDYHGVAIRRSDRRLVSWGRNDNGQAPSEVPGEFISVSAGLVQSYAIDSDNLLHCFPEDGCPEELYVSEVSGGNRYACAICLDDSSGTCFGEDRYGRAPSHILGSFRKVAAGGDHTLLIQEDGTILPLGRSEERQRDYPAGHTWSDISSGARHSCGKTDDTGEIFCWGDDSYGQTTLPEE